MIDAIKRLLLVFGALSVISIGIVECVEWKIDSRHRIIVYDQPWSSSAGVNNLICVPEIKGSCEREAKESELDFSKRLPAAFSFAEECKTVQFVIDSNDNEQLKDSLTQNASEYWRLRVDFHPRFERQPFTLGPGMGRPLIWGGDTEHDADFICKAAKNNGVIDIW
jgi:hypothetical protein